VRPLVPKGKKPGRAAVGRSLVSLHNPASAAAEQIRTIRNNIRYANGGKDPVSVAVTSAAAGEGKTTAAVNLAVALAGRGRVLLVDANLRQPALHAIFGLKLGPGLTNVLAGQIGLHEAAVQTELARLDLLTGGPLLPGSLELLDSEDMKLLLTAAAAVYDTIVLDCPAVLEKPDTAALAGKCEGAVLIVRHGRTRKDTALEAKRVLEFAGVRIIGAVLNRKSG